MSDPREVVPRSTRPWRQGRRVGNHVYRQFGPEPSDSDQWVGSFPVAHDALIAVTAVNAVRDAVLAEAQVTPSVSDDAVTTPDEAIERAAEWLFRSQGEQAWSIAGPTGYWQGLVRAVLAEATDAVGPSDENALRDQRDDARVDRDRLRNLVGELLDARPFGDWSEAWDRARAEVEGPASGGDK